jgi:hypothetical protein
MGFACPKADEFKKQNPIKDRHKNNDTNFQCFIFNPPFKLLKKNWELNLPFLALSPPFCSLDAP